MAAVEPHLITHITINQVKYAIGRLGFLPISPPINSPHDAQDRIIIPWQHHRTMVHFTEEEGKHLVALSTVRGQLDFSRFNDAAHLLSEWNRRRLGPTSLVYMSNEGDLSLEMRSSLLVEDGASPAQIAAFLHAAHETDILAVNHFLAAFPEMRSSLPLDEATTRDQLAFALPLPHIAEHPIIPPPSAQRIIPSHDNTLSINITIDRIAATLKDLGIQQYDDDDPHHITTGFNGVPIAFFIESGPTLLIRAFWFPDLDPDSDFIRTFLICNDWNETSTCTKAFPTTDDYGLQVHVDYVAPMSLGLTHHQLSHSIISAVQLLLEGLHSISVDTCGTSAVHWPPPPP